MSVYSVNNPFSSGYGLNPYAVRRKAEDNNADSQKEQQFGPEQNLAEILTKPSRPVPAEAWKGEMELGGMLGAENAKPYNPNFKSLAILVSEAAKDLGIEGKVTYNDLLKHRDKMVEDFQAKVKDGLSQAGVDSNADFRINLDENGNIKVSSNHKDKAKIEQFFKENPSLSKDYQHIEALNQVEETRKNQGVDLSLAYKDGQLMSYGSGINMTALKMSMAMTGAGSLATILNGGIKATV